MITFLAAARTARHYERRGDYLIADALLMLIKANLSEHEARALGALESSDLWLDWREVAQLSALEPGLAYGCLGRLVDYGLAARKGGRLKSGARWRAAVM